MEEMRTYFTMERYAIEFNSNELQFYNTLGNHNYSYKERINHYWKLINESKTIKGYACKKVTVSYGCRE